MVPLQAGIQDQGARLAARSALGSTLWQRVGGPVQHLTVREVRSSLVRHGTVSSWYLIARRVLQYQITIY